MSKRMYYAVRNAQEDVISHVTLCAAVILLLDGHPVAGAIVLLYSMLESIYSAYFHMLVKRELAGAGEAK